MVFMIRIHYSFHFIFFSTTLPQPLPSTSSGFATLITQTATQVLYCTVFNSYRSQKTQWLKRILHSAAQNKHRGEATAKKPRRQEPCGQKRHTANSTVLTPAGQKHHSGWKEFCPPLVRKDTVANPLRRYHDSKAPCDIVYRIGCGCQKN